MGRGPYGAVLTPSGSASMSARARARASRTRSDRRRFSRRAVAVSRSITSAGTRRVSITRRSGTARPPRPQALGEGGDARPGGSGPSGGDARLERLGRRQGADNGGDGARGHVRAVRAGPPGELMRQRVTVHSVASVGAPASCRQRSQRFGAGTHKAHPRAAPSAPHRVRGGLPGSASHRGAIRCHGTDVVSCTQVTVSPPGPPRLAWRACTRGTRRRRPAGSSGDASCA